MDKLSIRNHIHVYGYGYGDNLPREPLSATHWERRLAPRSAYQADEPTDVVLSTTITLDSETGYGVDYEVLVCADYEPAQRGGWEDESWEAYWHSPEAWYYRKGRGWKRLELTDRVKEQLLAELDREAEYRRNYRD
jgi:hypothetical protein